jgi:pimeloyl-ACP methyl ester carboxylesterase
MKRTSILILSVSACLISTGLAQVQNSILPHIKPGAHGSLSRLLHGRALSSVGSSRLPATSDAIPTQCPPDAVAFGAAACGYVKVPLDRGNLSLGKIRMYFELYLHSGSGPAESAILADIGGPGVTTTGIRDFWLFLYGANLDVHDLLLIDDRGRGFSNTIDCEELQHGTASFSKAEADCAAQLGATASRYGTGDIAKDTDAVRVALGYDKVDYHGGSYGGEDVTAYATRFGEHLRSVVLDAPAGTPDLRAFQLEHDGIHATPRELRLDCRRSPTCLPDHPDPNDELQKVVLAIRQQPFEGDAYDASGNLVHVRVDEKTLLRIAAVPTGSFVSTGELLAAAASLKHGDRKPLLRLAAELPPALPTDTDNGDPTGLSVGASYATFCGDVHQPWDWSSPVSQRKVQFANTASALPSDYFAPFSKAASTSLAFSLLRQCLWWEKPSPSSPVAAAHAIYPDVPTLVLNGDMDTSVPLEETTKVAALFPNSSFVKVAEAGHETAFYSQCARDIMSRFIETRDPGDTSCATTPETVYPAVGRFPVFARHARASEIDPSGNNRIGVRERKVVTVAVAVMTDALQRFTIGSGEGVGLRSGKFHTEFRDSGITVTFDDCAFAEDVFVNGTLLANYDSTLVADLTISGPGTKGGTLHVEGNFLAAGPVGKFRVTGVLGGRQVAVLIPQA